MAGSRFSGRLPNPVLALIYLLHTVPVIATAFLIFGRWGQVSVILAPAAAWWLVRRSPWAHRFSGLQARLYALGAAGLWIILGWFYEGVFSPTYYHNHVLTVFGVGLLFGFAIHKRHPIGVAVATWLFLTYMVTKVGVGQVAVLFLGFTSYGLVLWRRAREAISALSWVHVVPAVSALFFVGFIGLLRFARYPQWEETILRQSGVESVLSMGRGKWPEDFSPQVRFVLEDCEGSGVFAGSTGELSDSHDSLIHLREGLRTIRASGTIRASNNALLNCDHASLIVGSENTSEVHVYSPTDISAPRWSVPIPGSQPRILTSLKGGRFIAAQDDGTFRPHFVTVEYPRALGSPEIDKAQCAFSPEEDTLWLVSSYRNGKGLIRSVVHAAHGGLEIEASASRTWGEKVRGLLRDSAFCAYDTTSDAIWFAQFHFGVLDQVDRTTGRVIRSVRLRRGLRFLAVNEPKRLLAVSNYLTGDVTFVHLDSGEILGTARLGPRVRWITFSGDARRAYAASSAGVFRVSLTKTGILSPETTPPTP